MFIRKSDNDDIAKLMAKTLDDKSFAFLENESVNADTSAQLDKAVDFLNSAANLFEDAGMRTEAEMVTVIIEKIASMPDMKKIKHESEKEVKNLKHTGTMFSFDKSDAKDQESKELDLDEADVDELNKMLSFEDEE